MSSPEELAACAQEHDSSAGVERGVWEGEVGADPMITTSLRLPKSLLGGVRQEAVAQHQRPSGLIRQGIEQRRDAGRPGGPGRAGDTGARLERLERAVPSTADAP